MGHKTLEVDRFPELEATLGVQIAGCTAVAEWHGDALLESSDWVWIIVRGEIIGSANKLEQDLDIIAVAYNADGDVVCAGAPSLQCMGEYLHHIDAASFVGIEPFEIRLYCASVVHGSIERVRVYPRPADDD